VRDKSPPVLIQRIWIKARERMEEKAMLLTKRKLNKILRNWQIASFFERLLVSEFR
jgi:hypothetical protein